MASRSKFVEKAKQCRGVTYTSAAALAQGILHSSTTAAPEKNAFHHYVGSGLLRKRLLNVNRVVHIIYTYYSLVPLSSRARKYIGYSHARA